jgi:hypothetical protein
MSQVPPGYPILQAISTSASAVSRRPRPHWETAMGHNRTPQKAGLAPGSAFPTAEFEGQDRVAHRKTASRGPTTTHLRSYLRFILVGPLSYGSHRAGRPTTTPESRVTQSCARSAKRGESLLNLIPTESDVFDIHRVEHENALCEGLSSGMKVGKGPGIHTAAQRTQPSVGETGSSCPSPSLAAEGSNVHSQGALGCMGTLTSKQQVPASRHITMCIRLRLRG